jgi:NAD(P)-dependent dehydrogenase (short-subunit alcohol dehydrogenase family)
MCRLADFDGKISLVTGAGSGIGRAVAELYAQGGARVIVADINDAAGDETVRRIRAAGGQALFCHTDVSSANECEKLVRFAVEKCGRLDIACNNAGISGESSQTADYSLEGWNQVISTNLSGIFYCMRYEIPAMLEHGNGVIVNMSSVLGQVAFATSAAYVAAKHGVIGLTRTAAVEYARLGIRVNAVGPSFIKTSMISVGEDGELPYIYKMLASQHPVGRLGEASEVAELVAWLSSDKASFVTGSFYPVDGGYLAR